MFNKDMLILAREFRGYTQKELVEKLEGISQGHLSKLELGVHDISENVIKQLSLALNLPKSFFTQNKAHYGLPLSINGNFRKKQSLSKKNHLKIKGLINIILYNIEDLLQRNTFKSKLLDLEIKYKNTNNNQENSKILNFADKKKIAKIVNIVKQALNIKLDTPIENVVKVMEQNQILIIDVNFNTDLVDGFSYWIGDIPVIFVSRNISGDRQRFTILHELGHIILHKNYFNEQMEAEANYFASEFLLPESGIKQDLNYITLEKLANLKIKWKASMSAILMRAKDLQVINDYIYKTLFINMSKSGYRKVEPVVVAYEDIFTMKNIINNIKDNNIEEILHLNQNTIKEIYGI